MKPLPFTSDKSTMAIIRNAFGNVSSAMLQLQLSPNPPEGALYGMALLFSFAGNILPLGTYVNLIVAKRLSQVRRGAGAGSLPPL